MIAALYSDRNEEIPEVKTISAAEFPGMAAAKQGADGASDDGARAKALLFCF